MLYFEILESTKDKLCGYLAILYIVYVNLPRSLREFDLRCSYGF
jgi:hypothetical protein